MTYCTIPTRLGSRGLRALERYAEETGVVLVSERRGADRRSAEERRTRDRIGRFQSIDRRTIHNHTGRRVAERRAAAVPVVAPRPLPRRLRSHADEIRFLEPLELSREHLEDVETARLLVRIQGGEKELFGKLYRQWFDRIYTYARANLERSVLAEEATQDVFAELYEELPRHQVDSGRFRAWFAGIASRRIRGHLIAIHGPEQILEEEPARSQPQPVHEVPSWVTDADLHVLVARLPLPQRRVVMLRYLMALSQTEVADIVESSAATVGDLHASALAIIAERQHAIGKPSEAKSVRFAMARRRRSARVLQSRRLALTPG
jgi:RNA polymerase sigma factor (sigma-70 family)